MLFYISGSSQFVTDKHNNFPMKSALLPSKAGTKDLHKECKFLSLRRILCWGGGGARASKNIINLCYHLKVTFFLIQCLVSYCKPLTVFQSSEKLGLTVFACQCFCGGMGTSRCILHFAAI